MTSFTDPGRDNLVAPMSPAPRPTDLDLPHPSEQPRSLEAFVDRAVNGREFLIQYQPVFSLATHGVIGFEALIRWCRPTVGSPIQLPTSYGREIEAPLALVERWVLADACRRARSWGAGEANAPWISLKLSPSDLGDPRFADDAGRMVVEAGVPTSTIVLEFGLDLMAGDPAPAFERLRDRGFSLAVDGFGSDLGALRHLVRLPLDNVKIARSLVERIPANHEATALAEGLIGLAHSLGIQVVAAGLASHDQLRSLQSSGCDAGQGPLLGEPMDAEAAGDLVFASSLRAPH
jgi:EAL domain-containing protein (putative c-di-GMP-specific phosphodiesterase class I)